MLLQITEHCSAGCSHCPYQAENIFLSLGQIQIALASLKDPFVTLSGGEPLEHPDFEMICCYLESQGIAYRVATGGHIGLGKVLPQLQAHHGFLGVSMGTDILSSRNSRYDLKKIWLNNLSLLELSKVSWSLTVTPDWNEDFTLELGAILKMNVSPKFIMINKFKNGREGEKFVGWLQKTKWRDLPFF
jgi:MoaA/NifB/PqqE/SkfB family radical SAM enzyme